MRSSIVGGASGWASRPCRRAARRRPLRRRGQRPFREGYRLTLDRAARCLNRLSQALNVPAQPLAIAFEPLAIEIRTRPLQLRLFALQPCIAIAKTIAFSRARSIARRSRGNSRWPSSMVFGSSRPGTRQPCQIPEESTSHSLGSPALLTS